MATYKHGIYPSVTDTEMPSTDKTTVAQVVIGTAPVHLLDDPASAVNKPVLCEELSDCYSKIGYSTNFKKYTLCQSMYLSFFLMGVSPIVFINVLDPEKHFEEVEATEYKISDNSIIIDDDVIVKTLLIKDGDTEIKSEEYFTEWADGKLTVNFADTREGTVNVSYNRIAPDKVTKDDIIGKYNTQTNTRTGCELIKDVFPRTGVIPFIITAPGWSTDDTIGAILMNKTTEINGCYQAEAILDLDTSIIKSKSDAIQEKNNRTTNENCLITFPMIKKNGNKFYYSALLSAIIMYQATKTGGVTCKSPSNFKISIDDCVLEDDTSVYYDQEDGNELNAEGIVTIIARNGWYTWGNNTAAYPAETDPVKRWIMTRLTFLYIENDFINSNFAHVDDSLSPKIIDDYVTDYNIKLASFKEAGYILGGKITYDASDNPASNLLDGHFKFRTPLAANIPGEYVENIFSFDVETLQSAIFGGEE